MSRRLAALFRLLCVFGVASLLAAGVSDGAQDTPAAKPVEKKAPAHQVPAEMIEKLLQEKLPVKTRADGEPVPSGNKVEPGGKPGDGAAGKPDAELKKTGQGRSADTPKKEPEPDDAPQVKPSPGKAPEQAAKGAGDKPERAKAPEAKVEAAHKIADPGLPRRKPRKPVVRKKDIQKADGKKQLTPGSDRQKYLCRALQSCRNDFIRCKSKIKYPDQSPQWIVAKEACGAIYKACVEKDFHSGEWFFTRWFYFQELNCK